MPIDAYRVHTTTMDACPIKVTTHLLGRINTGGPQIVLILGQRGTALL